MGGAVTSIAEGIHAIGYNPAMLAYSPKNFSMNLGSFALGLANNLLSVSNYNLVNGADFIDSTSADYVNKQEFLDGIPDDGMRFKLNMHMPMPVLDWARGTTAFSSDIIVFGDIGLPKAVVQLLMEGNTIGEDLDLNLADEMIAVGEWGFSFAMPTTDVSFGFTIKYLQGLFYLGIDPDSSFGYFRTEPTGLYAEGQYLVRQAVGGNGFGLDFGFATREIDGFRLGMSLINAIGKIKWHGPSLTKDIMGETLQGFMPWRENEYYLYRYRIDGVTVQQFQELPTDSLFQKEGYTVVETENGLVRSDTLSAEDIKALAPSPFVTNYPSLFRIGISKRLPDVGIVSLDILTGFQDRLWASRGWQLAVGLEVFPRPSLPIRMGFRYGGQNRKQLGVGFGIHKGPFHFDTAVTFNNGFWLHTAKGLTLGMGLTLVR